MALRRLTIALQYYLHGLDRTPHRFSNPIDLRGMNQIALVGFGPTFFKERKTGRRRFNFSVVPKDLRILRVNWDRDVGLDVESLQSDLFVLLEADNLMLLIDGLEYVLAEAQDLGYLRVRDVHIGTRRGDRRNGFGFLDGVRNPGLSGMPTVEDVAFVERSTESRGLGGGTYLVFRKYSLNVNLWGGMPRAEQETIIGQDKETGRRLGECWNSHAELADQDRAGWMYRRGMSYAALQPNGTFKRGLLFLSFHASQSAFENFYNEQLMQPGRHDALLTHPAVQAQNADAYFVPDFSTWQWGYVGQVFFEPEPAELSLQGGTRLADGDLDDAEKYYLKLAAQFPDHLLGYTELGNLYGEMWDAQKSLEWSRKARKVAPDNYLALSSLAWAEYLAGDFEASASSALAAVEGCYADDYRGFPYHTLAAALLMLGRLERAETAARRSLARVPDEPLLTMTLATILEAQGHLEDAAATYDRVVEIVSGLIARGIADGLSLRTAFRVARIAYRSTLSRTTVHRVENLVRRE